MEITQPAEQESNNDTVGKSDREITGDRISNNQGPKDKIILGLLVVVVLLLMSNGILAYLYFTDEDDDDGEHEDNGNGGGETPEQIIQGLTVYQAYTLIQNNTNNTDFHIIDVRTLEEFDEGHIANALVLDFFNESFEEWISMLDRNLTYLVYCNTDAMSGLTLDRMTELGFIRAYSIINGLDKWKELGYDVET